MSSRRPPPYIETFKDRHWNVDRYRCTLCKWTSSYVQNAGDMQRHCASTGHMIEVFRREGEEASERVVAGQGPQNLLMQQCSDVLKPSFHKRVERLYNQKHQNDIYALQMRHLLQQDHAETGTQFLDEAERMLKKYEMFERVVAGLGPHNLFIQRCSDVLKPSFHKRVERLYDEKHQNDIYALQMRHLLQADAGTGTQYLIEAEQMLKEYEMFDRLSVLELALWKAACIVGVEHNEEEDSLESQDS